MTAPLTPAECDLRDFPRMMLDIIRLRASSFDKIRDDAAWRAGLNLWMSSWHQVPAGSLPNDEDELTSAAGLGRDVKSWRKVRVAALRGWVLADDGLLYHEVVSEIAIEAWLDKLGSRLSSDAGNAKRYGHDFDPSSLYEEIRRAAEALERLNPKSKALRKQHVMKSRKGPAEGPAEAPAGAPTGKPPGEQVGSQGNRSDQNGVEKKKDKPSSSAGKPAKPRSDRRKPAVSIPDGFPDADALAEQRAKALAAGADLDVSYQAERFRGWALSKDQKFADWRAAWRNWMVKAIADAPRLTIREPAQPTEWHGPDKILRLLTPAFGSDKARDYLAAYCAWQEVPYEAVIVADERMAKLIKSKAGAVLEAESIAVLVKGRAA